MYIHHGFPCGVMYKIHRELLICLSLSSPKCSFSFCNLHLELFVYLRLIGTLFLCISAHLTVLLLFNPVLNLIFLLLPITSSHSHASASDSTFDYCRYINISLTLALTLERKFVFSQLQTRLQDKITIIHRTIVPVSKEIKL